MYALSYRDLSDMMLKRNLNICYSTIFRLIKQYTPILNIELRKHLNPTNYSCLMNVTYIKLNIKWMYLYRAVDSKRVTIDFWLSKNRDEKATKNLLPFVVIFKNSVHNILDFFQDLDSYYLFFATEYRS